MKKAKKITTPTGKPVKAKGPTGHATKIGRSRAGELTVDNYYTFKGERLRSRGPS